MTDLKATLSTNEDLIASLDESPVLMSEMSDIMVAGVSSWNGATGDVTYTPPVTSVNGQTGDVTVSSPTKTSELTNDSGFITSADVPTKTSQLQNDSGFLTQAVTSFNGQSGAVTYNAPVQSVNGQTGAVTVNVPTKTSQLQNDSSYITSAQAPVQSVNGQTGAVTVAVPTQTSQLTNDSGYITSAGAPVQSVNGRTGAVTVTEGLTPLVGLYTNITPTQVLTALQEGRAITLTYIDNTYGPLTFNYFIYAMGMNLVFAQTIIFLVGGAYSATINGDLTTDTWTMTMGHMMMHSSLNISYAYVPNVTSVGTASSWAFVYDDSTEEISISGTNGTAPTLGSELVVVGGVGLQED